MNDSCEYSGEDSYNKAGNRVEGQILEGSDGDTALS